MRFQTIHLFKILIYTTNPKQTNTNRMYQNGIIFDIDRVIGDHYKYYFLLNLILFWLWSLDAIDSAYSE